MKFSLFTPVAFSALASYAVALSDKDFVCKQLQVMADIKQDYLDQFYPQSKGKRGGASQPAGGLVVQKVDKNQDGSFEVTASFAAQDPSALNDAISVSSVKVAGLGAGDVDITDDVANPFQWTKTFTVQAEKKALPSKQKRGKIEDAFNENFVCCLPGTFEILIAPAFPKGKSAATSTMASTFKYGVEPVNTSLLEEVDPSSTKASLDKALGVSLRKRGPFNFRKRNDKLEEQWLKTTQMMLQYCWSCGCEDQSSSSSSSSSTTSLQSSTSAEPSTTQEPSTSEQPSTTQEPSTSEQPSTTQEPSTS